MAKKTYDLLYKLLLVGDSGVGKTSLIFRYSEDTFSQTFIATIGIDFKIKTITHEGKKIKLQIWDTAGQERFHTITTSYYRGAMGIMLVYDVTDRKSFEHVGRWLTTIQTHASSNVEKILVANKVDATDLRVVSSESGKAVARENSVKYVETSAKDGYNVELAFEELTKDIYRNTALSNERSALQEDSSSCLSHGANPASSQSSMLSCCSSS